MQNMMNAGDFHSAEPWLYEECLRENIRARVEAYYEAYYNNEESRMTEDMKKNRLFTTICLMAAILFTACTQDELAEQGNTLPDGEYPLQIGSVSITAEASEEPWTRVGENEDGSGNDYEGIGGAGDGEVGTLTIQDATVHTYGGSNSSSFAPGIGVGFSSLNGTYASALPKVVVSNSIIHTHRGGGNADYIGWTGSTSGTGGGTNSIQAGADGSITNSTVYCYTGDTLDKTVTYDASGNGTEQSQ